MHASSFLPAPRAIIYVTRSAKKLHGTSPWSAAWEATLDGPARTNPVETGLRTGREGREGMGEHTPTCQCQHSSKRSGQMF